LRKEPTIIAIAAAFRSSSNENSRGILWVDSNDNDCNRALTAKLQSLGVVVERHFSTETAIASLAMYNPYHVLPPSRFRVVTNRARDGDDNAWLAFAKQSRALGYNGPILLFHSVDGTSKIDPNAAVLVNVVPTCKSADAEDFMSFKSHVNSRFPIDHMFPHFATLAQEGVASKVVRGTDPDVLSQLEAKCSSCAVSDANRAAMYSELQAAVYVKHYLPRSCIDLHNSTLSSCIFRHVESLVLQYTVLHNHVTGSCPRVERVIAIENSHLKARFHEALNAKQAAASAYPKPFSFPTGVDEYMDVLRMQLPEIPSHNHARPCLVFHATSDDAEKLICSIGFRREFMASATGLQKFGAGIYFSTFPMYSSLYQAKRNSSGRVGEICFLACWVIMGHPYLKKQSETNAAAACGLQAGFDSHYTLVRQGNSIFDARGIATVQPDGDEIVIFEPHLILPQFVIEMNMVGGAP
jgi:hypothetical protein